MADIGMEGSEISDWYRNKTIFVTGGTGFMGKVLIEKLLRACNVRKIYLLMRPKKGVDISQRLDDMKNFRIFENILTEQPEMWQKIVPVRGDITMEGLGISDEDEARLAEEVEIVFHVAATINFQEPLRVAVNMNILGTKRMVALAHKMPNIKALVHVSTAYSNCPLLEIKEELYSAPIDPARLIQLTEWFDDEMLEAIEPNLLAAHPNTYTYTKAVAEHLLVNDIGTIPYSIVRPSIVCGAYREPLPGWVDHIFAFTGLLVGFGNGVLRSSCTKPGMTADFIPVDIAINLMIAAAWNTDVKKFKSNGQEIFFCATGSENPLKTAKLFEYVEGAATKYPFNSPLWYPVYKSHSNKFINQLHVFFVNGIPSHITDVVLRMMRRKPVAVKLINRMQKAINSLQYFMLHSWTFHNTNARSLYQTMCPIDKESFNFDVSQIDWKQYTETYLLGVKQYIMKEPMSSLDDARRTNKRMYWLHCIVRLILVYWVWCIVSSNIACDLYSAFFDGASYLWSFAPIFMAIFSAFIDGASYLLSLAPGLEASMGNDTLGSVNTEANLGS